MLLTTAMICLVAASEATGTAYVTADNLDKYLASYLQQVETRLRAAKRGQVNANARHGSFYFERGGNYLFRTLADRQTEVKRLQGLLIDPVLPPLLVQRPKSNQVGSLRQKYATYRVIQLIDDRNAIVEAKASVPGPNTSTDWQFWLRGSVAGTLREGRYYDYIEGSFQLAGHQQYQTVLGASKTVDLVEQYDLASHLQKATASTPAR